MTNEHRPVEPSGLDAGTSRRDFIHLAATAAGAWGLLAAPQAWAAKAAPTAEAVFPVENLMRDHGLQDRLLLIYDEAAHRLKTGTSVPPQVVNASAGLIRSYMEDYHEPLEEVFLFSEFVKDKEHMALVEVLRRQHQVGRTMTDEIVALSKPGARTKAQQARLASAMSQYVRMYLAHASREDTVLFPAVRQVVTPAQYDQLRRTFAAKERQLLKGRSFPKALGTVGDLEKTMGMQALADFTPQVKGP